MVQGNGLTIGILADDLTGACDAVLPFFNVGCQTRVILNTDSLASLLTEPDIQAWAVNTQSRHLLPVEAARVVRRAFEALRDNAHTDVFYKKVDSTLRGPVGVECLAALDALEGDCAVLVPAYPLYKRRTVGGYMLVDGIPVEQTAIGRDPKAPVRQSHLPTLLQQTVKPEWIGYVELKTVLHGAGPIFNAISDQVVHGKRLIVIDACSDTDMEQIALALQTGRKSLTMLSCGSAGLARALSRYWQQDGAAAPARPPTRMTPPPVAPATLFVAGSLTEQTAQQLKALQQQTPGLVILSPTPAVLLGLDDAQPLIDAAITALSQLQPVLLATNYPSELYPGTLTLADRELAGEATRRVEQTLTDLTRSIIARQPANLVITGGETAYYVCQALGCAHWQIWRELEPSVAVGWCQQQWVALKPGNFGSTGVFADVHHWFLKAADRPASAT